VLGQNQPGPVTTKTNGGNYFPPSSCMQNDVLHAGGNVGNKINEGEEEFTWHEGGGALLVELLRWPCCGGGRWQCRCSRTAAPNSDVTVSSDGERGSCSSLLLCFLSSSSDTFPFPFVLV